jgi:hypothetical protein
MKVIHIFGYGENQIISDTLNFKASASLFAKAQAVIDDVKSKKPADVEAKDYHAINIFADNKVSYLTNDRKSCFSCKFADINQTKLNALIAEFQALKDAEPVKA